MKNAADSATKRIGNYLFIHRLRTLIIFRITIRFALKKKIDFKGGKPGTGRFNVHYC
jgi:hypothetical protein